MKITCPKCHSTYRVDLPDPGEAGIDVQCGNCLNIFLFSPNIEKPGPSEIQKSTSVKTPNSDLLGDQLSEPILPPQKGEDQEVFGSKKQPLQPKKQAPEKDREPPEKLALEPSSNDPEPIEFIVENEVPDDSLEQEALDDIWDQAVQEGARTMAKSKEKSLTPPSKKPAAETVDEDTLEEIPLPPVKKSQPPLPQKDPQQEKTQEEIDLDEEVVINEGEAIPSWEEAFAHQSEVETEWEKAQEQDRTQEEQQFAEALGEQYATPEPAKEETVNAVPKEDDQGLVDEIFAEVKSSQDSSKQTAKTPPPKSKEDPKQDKVDPIFAEAKAKQGKTQEEIDLDEEVVINEGEAIPSWEEAFANQAKVEKDEEDWKKAKEQDRTQEDQQLAEALGEENSTPAPAAATENPPAVVDDKFAQMKSQAPSADQPTAKEPPSSLTADAGTTAEEEHEPTWNKPEEQEALGKAASASENKEATPSDPTISGDIDLTEDLADMNMKQLVKQAFKEESDQTAEAPVSEKVETPTVGETAPKPELTLELEMEAPPEEPAAEQTAPVSQDEEDTDQSIDPYASSVDPPTPLEVEPIPELTLESAEEEPEVELGLEMEPLLEAAETPVEAETASTEPPEMELDPEPTMESSEATAPFAEQPAVSQEPSFNKESEEIWADLLPEHQEEGQPVDEEAPIAFAEEEEEPFGENDFWDQVLEKDSEESPTAETEAEQQPVSSAPVAQETTPVAQDTAERETLTDEELWQQAFPGEEELESTASQYSDDKEKDFPSKVSPLVIGANVKLDEESEDSLKFDEAAYADDDDDEFEFQRRKRNLGPFTIPHGRRGDLVIGGAIVVFLLLAGSVYFTLQTFAPGELTDIQTAKTEVPEGLTPRQVPLDELVGDLTSPKPIEPGKTSTVDTPGDKGEAILSDPSKILEESPEEKGILKDLAESQILKDTGKTQTARINQSALLALTGHSVTLSTIIPVAYNPTDIRVLSFSVEIQLSDAQSAKMVRESLPVYEEIMNQTVEDFLRRKFYNDILYVKEKLQKRLQTAMNRSLKNGRVRKTKFLDFAIQ